MTIISVMIFKKKNEKTRKNRITDKLYILRSIKIDVTAVVGGI